MYLLTVALERVLQWANQGIDRLLPLHQVAIRFDMQGFKRHGGELQERLIILFQRFAGEGLKGSQKFLAGVVDQSFLFQKLSS